MGQMLSEEGDQDEAINYLIDALRWDSKNGWALMMMGNIFARYKDDVSTAMKYYNQALVVKPDDYITITNIGTQLMQQGQIEEAKEYFHKAIKINDKYPQLYHALGLVAEKENDLQSAFSNMILSIKVNPNNDVLFQQSVKKAFDIAQNIVETDTGKKIYSEYRKQLEGKGGRKIDIIQDENIKTPAKFELAENYNRESHGVRFKPDYPAVEHLIMHELVHLDLVIQARDNNENLLFVSDDKNKRKFIAGLGSMKKKLEKMSLPEDSIEKILTNLFEGVNSQIFNTPIDLFIENFLYNEFPELRPYQFLSLYKLMQEGIHAVTDKQIVEMFPKEIISKSKIYNLVNALQFKELYGWDLILNLKPNPMELDQAQNFYYEYLEYRDDKEPGEEYELMLNWAKDLELDSYFELVDENEFRNRGGADIDDLISSLEKDPFGLETEIDAREKRMQEFKTSQDDIGTNMAVVMFMVEALRYFKDKSQAEIKDIAFEIAMYGTQGYDPKKEDYKITAIPGKDFSGYQILGYYYVSWALAIPESLKDLQMPFDKEYEMARRIFGEG